MKPFGNPGVSFKMTSPSNSIQSDPILFWYRDASLGKFKHASNLNFWRKKLVVAWKSKLVGQHTYSEVKVKKCYFSKIILNVFLLKMGEAIRKRHPATPSFRRSMTSSGNEENLSRTMKYFLYIPWRWPLTTMPSMNCALHGWKNDQSRVTDIKLK